MLTSERIRLQMAGIIVETPARQRPKAMATFEAEFTNLADLIRVPRKPAVAPLAAMIEVIKNFLPKPKGLGKPSRDAAASLEKYIQTAGAELLKKMSRDEIANAMLEIVQCTYEAWSMLDPSGCMKALTAERARLIKSDPTWMPAAMRTQR